MDVYTDDNGGIYKGEFKDGLRHGQGVFTTRGGRYIWEGQWANGCMNGYGTYKDTKPLIGHHGEEYAGEWKDGKYHGQGFLIRDNCTDWDSYKGEFRDGKLYTGVKKDILGKRTRYRDGEQKGCYVATCVYGSYDCPQVWTLRRYRDYKLSKTLCGRTFIKCYYAISPTCVKVFGNQKWFKMIFKKILNRLVSNLKLKGFEDTPYDDM